VTVLVAGGLRRSSLVNAFIVSVTLLSLVMFGAFGMWHLASGAGRPLTQSLPDAGWNGASAFFYATALMFVAYTGYARIATLGEEVHDPGRTIPLAIILTLAVSAALYVLVAAAALGAVDAEVLGTAATRQAVPLETAARAMNAPLLVFVIALGAVSAMLGVLLNLLLGLSRVVLAMGRRRDLPPSLAVIGPHGDPRRAVVSMGILIALMALPGQFETTWAFSALTVLIYYAITNVAALRLPNEQRRYPPVLAWLGLSGCLALTVFLPLRVWILGGLLIAGGLIWRVLAQRLWPG
jgi:basic amino acid/polyamine antiporter, APA family